MQPLETHKFCQELRFQPAHALIPIQSGPRCRVCARLHSDPSGRVLCGGCFCAAYRPGDVGFFGLVGNLCNLQDWFMTWCEQNLNTTWAPVSGLGDATACWWWAKMNVSHSQCERSLTYVGPWLLSMLWQGWGSALGGPIREIWEFRFQTTLYYASVHCAFAIKLTDDSWWIFDPTGVQFGPDWPLLSSLNHYLLRAELSLSVRRAGFECRVLGSNAAFQHRRPW